MSKTDDSGSNELSDADKIKSVVETANAEDETDTSVDESNTDESDEEDADDASDDSADDDSEDDKSDDDEEDDESDDTKKASAERKFKNLAADDDKGYITNLEKAYENSSAEAVRLNTELGNTTRRINALMQVVGSDPDLAEKLNKAMAGTDDKPADIADPTENPFLADAQTKWREKSQQEVQEIVDANPELLSDPKINADVKHWMEVLSAEEMKTNKRLLSGGEAMEKAMKLLGIEDKRSKQSVASKAKELAAPSRPNSSRKPKADSKKASDAAYKFGELMGVSKETVDKYAQ